MLMAVLCNTILLSKMNTLQESEHFEMNEMYLHFQGTYQHSL